MMDAHAYATVKAARDLLVDGLGLCTVVRATVTNDEAARKVGHGITGKQLATLIDITNDLWTVLVDPPRRIT